MFRNAILMALLTIFTQQTQVLAQSSYGVWYTGCPTKWVNYSNYNSLAEANGIVNQLKPRNPRFYFAVVPNYNGSRIAPSTNPCGTGSNGGSGGGGGNGGGNGNGGGGQQCVGQISNPFFRIAKTVNGQYQYWGVAYCSRTSANNAYFSNYVALRNAGYTIVSGTLKWDTCGPVYYKCQNGQVVTVPNYQSSSSWATN